MKIFGNVLKEVELGEFLLEVENKILNIINEEMGIASDVTVMTRLAYNELKKHIDLSKPLSFNTDGIIFKKGYFDFKYDRYGFNINWTFYGYRNIKIYDKFPRNRNAYYDKGTNTINITYIKIDKWEDKEHVLEALQHEISHYFEELHKKRLYKNEDIYQHAISLLKSDDKFVKAISEIIYYNFKFEQRAFANGLYQILYNKHCINFDLTILKTTQVYNAVLRLRNNIELLKNNKVLTPYANRVLKDVGLTVEKCLQMADDAINGLIKKIGKTIVKVKTDLIRQGVIHEQYQFYTTQDAVRDSI